MDSYKRIKIPVTVDIDTIVSNGRVNQIELKSSSTLCDCCYDWYGDKDTTESKLYELYVNGELITDHFTATDVDVKVLLDALNIRYTIRS